MAYPLVSARLPVQGQNVTVLEESPRPASGCAGEVSGQIFAVGLALQDTVAITADPLVRRRIGKALDDLDQVVREFRDNAFGPIAEGYDGKAPRSLADDTSGPPSMATRVLPGPATSPAGAYRGEFMAQAPSKVRLKAVRACRAGAPRGRLIAVGTGRDAAL